jgi:AcrR family transcriptional regulator
VDKKDAIADAASHLLCTTGISGLTVARVARAARVSTALVHYHFATKQKLLAAAARQVAARRTALRLRALRAGRGLASLDAVWDCLVAGAAGDAERGWHDLVLLGREDGDVRGSLLEERERERLAVAAALPRLLDELGSRPSIPADDLAGLVITWLDGVAVALAGGARRDEVRAAYDAFCLALVALDRAGPGR